jgi:hypothetical protein
MGKEMMLWAVTELGPEFLNKAAGLQSGTKVKIPNAVKFRTGVWLFDSPIWHFIYRLCVYLAPFSEKDWAMGDRFFEWILAHDKLNPGEKTILKDLCAIHGSRNGVFWVRAACVPRAPCCLRALTRFARSLPVLSQRNAITIVIWRDRILEFLHHMQKVQTAKSGANGGKTRDYLIFMLENETVYLCLLVLAYLYLGFYRPLLSAVINVKHVRELVPICQHGYSYFVSCSEDPLPFLRGETRLYPEQRIDDREELFRDKLLDMTGVPKDARLVPLVKAVLTAGARAYWHHHVEHMDAEHFKEGEAGYDDEHGHWVRSGGTATTLTEEEHDRRRNMHSRSTCAERAFAVLKHFEERAPTRNEASLCALVQFVRNKSGDFWAARFETMSE